LLVEQFPHWAGLPVRPVRSSGTDNALYRLGDDLLVRLPRIDWAVGQVDRDLRWLPQLAPRLPLTIPEPLAGGAPGAGYPWRWGIYRWLDGRDGTSVTLTDPMVGTSTGSVPGTTRVDLVQAAVDLAQFLVALQRIDPAGGPRADEHGLRGVPLATRDEDVRAAIAALDGLIDTDAALAAWEAALDVPDWNQEPVWFHGDVLPGNLLFKNGRLSAVIDFAGAGVGDPAPDLMIAWNLFSGASREAFRSTLAIDDATWARGCGHALAQALIFIPYYLYTNPVGVAVARHAVDEVLSDWRNSR
ncbi:MAG: aminoglycoside phosphotransferase family protein, partial [Anaerolineae bacterium]|nr:aminoglycoside phosphotransferase family protein [Anaerolineae bacterium]